MNEYIINDNGRLKIISPYFDGNKTYSYKDRTIDLKKPIRVYRNLNRKGKCYSIVQNGKTVAHSYGVCIRDCKLKVNEKGKQRVIKNKRKEFHAFIEGYYTHSGMGTSAHKNDLPAIIEYNPYKDEYFNCKNLTLKPFKVNGARFIICNKEGVKGAYLY